jgi:hypothetical protein
MNGCSAHTPAQVRPACPAPTPLTWRRSSRSVGMNNCVETARDGADGLAVRDSKNVALPHLSFTTTAWTPFVAGLHGKEFSR